MSVALNGLVQVALSVKDVNVAESFYGETLGLRKLFRYGDLLFYDMAGVRLMISKAEAELPPGNRTVLYFRVADIALAHRELRARGVAFEGEPHLIAPMADHDLWLVAFRDPDGNLVALMHEAPKGYAPAPSA